MRNRTTFTAQFESECTSCCALVFEGDEASFVDDEFVCVSCWEDASEDDCELDDWF